MARRRYVSTDISIDNKTAGLAEKGHVLALLLYTWAIPHMDDWGRITGDAREFRRLVCPDLDKPIEAVEEALNQVADAHLWQRYQVKDKWYLAVPEEPWFRIQSYINRGKRLDDSGSKIPKPPTPQNAEEHRKTPQNAEEQQETPQNTVTPSPSPSPSPTPTLIKDLKDSSSEPAGSDLPPEEKAVKPTRTPKTFHPDSEPYRLSILLRQRILANDAAAKVPQPTPEGMARWCKDMDLLIRVDSRAPDEVERIINWCQNDDFWRGNILSPGKLREKFTALKMQSTRAAPGKPKGKAPPLQQPNAEDEDKWKLLNWGNYDKTGEG